MGKVIGSVMFVYRGGATHQLAARAFAKLRREVLAGRGGTEVADLVAKGFTEYLGDDGQVYAVDNISEDTFRR
jgi:hypothetical protein